MVEFHMSPSSFTGLLVLNKILGNWLSKTSTNDEKAKISNLPKHAQAKIAVEAFKARKGKPFNALMASSVSLESITSNIVTLNERINFYANNIENGLGLVSADAYPEFKKITLDSFFTDEEGNYISMYEMNNFITSCERLFQAIDDAIKREDSDISFSIRLLNKCIGSIQNVCKAAQAAA